MDDLQRAVDEFEALRSMYPEEEGCFVLADAERQALAAAQAAVQSGAIASNTQLKSLSGSVRLPHVLLGGAPVSLHFQLPLGYPSTAAPRLLVECTAPRLLHEQLMAAVNRVAEEALGSESLLLVLDALQEEVTSVSRSQDSHGSTAAAAATAQCGQLSSAGQPDSNAVAAAGATQQALHGSAGLAQQTIRDCEGCLMRAVVWFHHIKSTTKRKLLVGWGRELGVRGFSKPGFPGVLVAEGAACDVREFLARIRSLQWQAMQVRGQELLKCGACQQQQQQQQQQQTGPCWGFTDRFTELPETGMSELGQLCTTAGMEELFLAALKIAK